MLIWLTRKENKSVLDKQLKEQLGKDTEYYHNVLKRVVAVVKYLAIRGLAFRCTEEVFGSPHNGSFICALELCLQSSTHSFDTNREFKERGTIRTSCAELWFQQDGATCHTARATIDLLKDTFGDRLISRFGPVNWPPRSCDLTPLDYFLWGYVKSLVYVDKPQTLDHLEDNIRRVIADIQPQMLEKVTENWTSRLDYIRASRNSHMPEVIFKM
ncbi:transposable element Tc3 transposase [Trichonephila clavipes]|nr:transposable element Tc3 transposase [Trichonephila clavipes]